MSLETVTITRQFPIINGFVQLPNNLEKNRSEVSIEEALLALPAATVTKMSAGVGGRRLAGGKFGIQEWIETSETFTCCPNPVDTDAEILKDEIPSNRRDGGDPPPPGEGRWNEMPCECTREFDGTIFMVDLVDHNGIAGCCARGVPELASSSILLEGGDNCQWIGTEQNYGFVLELVVTGETCYWLLTITCPEATSIWSGTKLAGSSPAGTYIGSAGCATTDYPTITVLGVV